MANDYYTHSGYPAYEVPGDTASARAEFDAIQTGFNSLNNVPRRLVTLAGTNTLTATAVPALLAYVTDQLFTAEAAGANTGAVTISISSLAALNLLRPDGTALQAGDIPGANYPLVIQTRATDAVLLNPYNGMDPVLSGRNRVINGDMQIAQVNGTAAVTPAASVYVLDQWDYVTTQASKLTFQQVADAPAGFKYSLKVSVAAQFSPGAADNFVIAQPIEGHNLIDIQFGLAGANKIAVSLWVKGSVAGTYACSLRNGALNRSYVGTIAATTGWGLQTVILTADTTGTWATDNTAGLWFSVDLGSGTNFNATAGAWGATNSTRTSGAITFVNQAVGSTLHMTGIQIEPVPTTATAGTSFEYLPYETQLRRCQRYLPVLNSDSTGSIIGSAYSNSTVSAVGIVQLPTATRIAPTGIVSTAASQFTFKSAGAFVGSAIAFYAASTTVGEFFLTIAAATAGQGGHIFFNNASAQLYFTGAQM